MTDVQAAALTQAYRSVVARAPGILRADFDAVAGACDVHPVVVGGEIAGAVLVNGPEVHACVASWAVGKWMRKSHLKLIAEIVDRHGMAVTSATTEMGRQFVERLGFMPDGEKYVKVKHGL